MGASPRAFFRAAVLSAQSVISVLGNLRVASYSPYRAPSASASNTIL